MRRLIVGRSGGTLTNRNIAAKSAASPRVANNANDVPALLRDIGRISANWRTPAQHSTAAQDHLVSGARSLSPPRRRVATMTLHTWNGRLQNGCRGNDTHSPHRAPRGHAARRE